MKNSIGNYEKAAALLIKQHFGPQEKWQQTNRALWRYFKANHGYRLTMLEIASITANTSLTVDDFLVVLSVLVGQFIQLAYYRTLNSGQITELSESEFFTTLR